MKKTFIARLLLTLAAIIFGIGAVLHAAAYWSKSRTRIDMSDLPAFLAAELKVLWLADSTTLMALAIIFAFIAAKPASVAPRVIVLLAVIPAGTTLLLYLILGAFYAAHLLALTTGMVVIAGLMMPSPPNWLRYWIGRHPPETKPVESAWRHRTAGSLTPVISDSVFLR